MPNAICHDCKQPLIPGGNWGDGRRRRGQRFCKPCDSARMRDYTRRNPDIVNRNRGSLRQRRIPLCKAHSECYVISRAEVWSRGQGLCGICGEKIAGQWHMDHIVPVNRGGTHCYLNLQPTHDFCNLSKGDKTMEEYSAQQSRG